MNTWKVARRAILTLVVIGLCAGCAQGGASGPSGAGTGSITMYGTIDQGISYSTK
jgi:ABC-type glycerol-3-phosphate transport system substrate-binding protein